MGRILAVESSCDDTGLAIYDGSTKHFPFEWVGQQQEGVTYGGVIPELAARAHLRNLRDGMGALGQGFSMGSKPAQLGLRRCGIEAIAYTAGPGLAGGLWVGGLFAQTLSKALGLPLLAIDHLESHLFSAFIGFSPEEIPFPFLALLASGGHTQLWLVKDLSHYQLLGETCDDAAGEALDKGARWLGLGYPGGPALEASARLWDREPLVKFPVARIKKGQGLAFSFSGLKTALKRAIQRHGALSSELRHALAFSYQEAVFEALLLGCKRAVESAEVRALVVVGGVSANRTFRKRCHGAFSSPAFSVFFPQPKYCGDNGSMVAFLAHLYWTRKDRLGLVSQTDPKLLIYPTTRVCRLADSSQPRGLPS